MPKQIKKKALIVKRSKSSNSKRVKLNEVIMELTITNKKSNFSIGNKNFRKQLSPRSSTTIISKKLIIKNCKSVPNLPENYNKLTWKKLHDAVLAIQNGKTMKYTLEELYQTVQNLCENKMGDSVYEKLKSLIDTYVSVGIITFIDNSNDCYKYIVSFNTWWQKYCDQMSKIRSIFLYLDRTFVLQRQSQIMSVWDLGLCIFQSYIICNSNVQCRIEDGILDLIKKERCGEEVDRALIRSLIKMFVDLNLYKCKFEERYFVETVHFYYDEGYMSLIKFDIPEYLKHINQRLKEEEERMTEYMQQDTVQKTIKIILKQLLGDHLTEIIKKGFENLLDNNSIDDLSLMYDLLKRVRDGTSELCTQFNSYIKSKGADILTKEESEIIQNLLDFKTKIDNIVTTSFKDDAKFITTVKEAFEYFINHRPNKPAELLAKFVDSQLKAGNKKSTDDELEKLLDKVMVFFRFIHSKDVFEAFYKKDLAKRLLVGKSASVDSEKSLLSKLKQECGGGFTSKLEGMFKDMELSKDINVAFKQHLINIVKTDQLIDLTVNILTMGFWPTYPVFEVTLPATMAQYQSIFTTFYMSKYSGRKLQWQPKLGYCVLQSSFPQGNKELQVSLFQTLVLLLFNNSETLQYEEIKQSINMEDKELKRTLQSLACGKARVLKKVPKGKDVDETDKFRYNNGFTNKYYRVKINQIQMKETPEEQKSTEDRVFHDRQYQIDAAIVRIMKMKKTLSHNLLITELYDKLKFPMRPIDLKKRIESLIDQEYIERDNETGDQYHYVA